MAQTFYPSTYFHQSCQWFFDPPPSRQLVLEISTMQKGGKKEQTCIEMQYVKCERNFVKRIKFLRLFLFLSFFFYFRDKEDK